ncbi:ubiquitin carboxyl-terminal hydrolase [Trichonephila inaurata madagascariensis]|uniref:Ubiquitin carboxyl-terminal hydrolase n=1 Tax=Trichonephila inaurata madagascariensis TaxID=2747483 RepID=A0A8X6Y2V4_9ARAC|nr:ubiquitin carboxyl-terminal hydrolase [Trichonephila inaurata madagascariensis]
MFDIFQMARAEINQSLFTSSHTSLPHLNGPLPPKRSRLSLRRTTQFLHKPCYKEDDNNETKRELPSQETEDKSNVEMIDLTQDENASPNCISSMESKPIISVDDAEESDIKVWTLGLPNCGNTCFVNSILQVLRYTPDFLNSLHSLLLAHHQLSKLAKEDETKELIFFRHLHLLYSAMKRKEALMRINADKDYSAFLLKPVRSVISSLREVSLLFEEGEQHDAHELLITTINAFHTARHNLKKRFKNNENDSDNKEVSSAIDPETGPSTICDAIINQDMKKQIFTLRRRKAKSILLDSSVIENLNLGFEGKILNVIQCLECEKRLSREEDFTNLELNIPETVSCEDTVDLRECLSQTTILSGENKYFCEECQHHNEARMSSEVVKLPPILLLHFNWSRNSQEANNAEKSRIKLIIPRSFGTSENSEVFCCSSEENYKLFAIVLHIGRSTEGGHYVSFIKDAFPHSVEPDNDQKHPRLKLKPGSQFSAEPVNCCTTEEISNFKTIGTTTRWLLFDDNVVSPVCIDEDSETFPYFNYLSITASPCMIFYHKT